MTGAAFCNVVYAFWVEHLPIPEGKGKDPRKELDTALGVSGWPVPGQVRPARKTGPAGAPSWWHGEEEASQSFLRAMGVRPAGVT